MANLPPWVDALVPEPSPYAIMDFADGVIQVTYTSGDVVTYSTLHEAADALRHSDDDFDITPAIEREFGQGGIITYEIPGHTKSVGMLIHSTDKNRLASLERSYQYSLECGAKYVNNPTDFYTCHNFLDNHPAMWYPYNLERDGFHWKTNDLTSSIDLMVMKDSSDAVRIALEWGSPVHPGEGQSWGPRYHDYRLDVYGDTYEEAIIALASRVAMCHTIHGEDVEDVDLEEPEWVSQVKARMEEYTEALP